MISKAVGKYIRISPRKTRLVIDLIRGKQVDEALSILNSTNKKASSFLLKLLNSAVANAKRFPNIQEESLFVSRIYADGGPTMKRYRAEPMGRASVLIKRTSHIVLELDSRITKKQAKEAKKTEKVSKSPLKKLVKADKAKDKSVKTDKASPSSAAKNKQKEAGPKKQKKSEK